jgi:hypothetical protein
MPRFNCRPIIMSGCCDMNYALQEKSRYLRRKESKMAKLANLRLAGWAFTCLYGEDRTPEIFSWMLRKDADDNHAKILNSPKLYRVVSKVFPIYIYKETQK